MDELSKRLKELREQNGYSQEDLAQKLSISRQSISKWELGKSTPDITYFIKLSDIYKISLDELVKGKDVKNTIISDEVEIKKDRDNEVKNIGIFKKSLLFYKKDFKYRHTNPELVKIKTIGWLIIIGILLIIGFISH